MDQFLREYLSKRNIQYKLHEHPAVFTVEQSKKIKKKIPGLGTKSLFLKDDKSGQFYLVCLPGEKRLDIKNLQEKLNVKKLHFASSSEMKKELRVLPGSVSLFCTIHARNTILIVDKKVWSAEEVGFHPNINTKTLVLNHKALEKFYNSLHIKKHVIGL